MIFCKGVRRKVLRLYGWVQERRSIQTRGMYGLRRDGENKKKAESKAAATGAKIALIGGLFKLC